MIDHLVFFVFGRIKKTQKQIRVFTPPKARSINLTFDLNSDFYIYVEKTL